MKTIATPNPHPTECLLGLIVRRLTVAQRHSVAEEYEAICNARGWGPLSPYVPRIRIPKRHQKAIDELLSEVGRESGPLAGQEGSA